MRILFLIGLIPAFAHATPNLSATELKRQMRVEGVEILDLAYDGWRSRVTFPLRATLFWIFNHEEPVRLPDVYALRFRARKGIALAEQRCWLRDYGSRYVGVRDQGALDPATVTVVLKSECATGDETPELRPEFTAEHLSDERTVLYRSN